MRSRSGGYDFFIQVTRDQGLGHGQEGSSYVALSGQTEIVSYFDDVLKDYKAVDVSVQKFPAQKKSIYPPSSSGDNKCEF